MNATKVGSVRADQERDDDNEKSHDDNFQEETLDKFDDFGCDVCGKS
jgi:hypothetical protein